MIESRQERMGHVARGGLNLPGRKSPARYQLLERGRPSTPVLLSLFFSHAPPESSRADSSRADSSRADSSRAGNSDET